MYNMEIVFKQHIMSIRSSYSNNGEYYVAAEPPVRCEPEYSTGGKVCEYELKDDSYTKFISISESIKIIESARVTEDFWKLDKNVIESSVALVLVIELPDVKKTN